MSEYGTRRGFQQEKCKNKAAKRKLANDKRQREELMEVGE